MPRCWQWDWLAPLWGEARVAPCWTQPVPASSNGPNMGHGCAQHPKWSTLGEHIWERFKMLHGSGEWRAKYEKKLCEQQHRRKRGRERRRCSRWCSRASQYSLRRAHTGAVDKSVEVEATGTNCYGPTATHSPAPLRAKERSWGVGHRDVKFSLEKKEEGEKVSL